MAGEQTVVADQRLFRETKAADRATSGDATFLLNIETRGVFKKTDIEPAKLGMLFGNRMIDAVGSFNDRALTQVTLFERGAIAEFIKSGDNQRELLSR
jgi:hypothetical protein